jgi:hypothetical protein
MLARVMVGLFAAQLDGRALVPLPRFGMAFGGAVGFAGTPVTLCRA